MKHIFYNILHLSKTKIFKYFLIEKKFAKTIMTPHKKTCLFYAFGIAFYNVKQDIVKFNALNF